MAREDFKFEEFAMRLDYTFDSFPDIHFEIKTVISCGHDVAITWIITGTNRGKTGAFLPPGNQYIQPGERSITSGTAKYLGTPRFLTGQL
jgi:predicted ester cyclase